MKRLNSINVDTATGKTKEWLERVYTDMGMVPNFFRTLAVSPELLQAFVSSRETLERGILSTKLRQKVGLVVAECNRSDYCVCAHTALSKTLGLTDDEILDARRGVSLDSKEDAALHFAREVIDNRGSVSDDSWHRLQDAGCSDREIAEIIGWIGMYTFADYFTQLCQPELDFPKVQELVHA
jgi:uncharacterized peroxidase-related enzyme